MLNPDRYFSRDPAIRKVAGDLSQIVVSLPLVCPHGHVDPLVGLVVGHIIDMEDAREMIQDLAVNLYRRADKL